MTVAKSASNLAVAERPVTRTAGQGPGMPGGGAPSSGENARDFRGTVLRLAGLVFAERAKMSMIILFSLVSVGLGVLGPWLLGRATDMVVEAISASQAIDFSALLRLLAFTAGLQLLAAVFNWQQAWLTNDIVQDLSRKMRREAQEKLGRAPLSWFDRQPHGEVLSRVTNDVDNVSQSLQQLLSQFLMSLFQVIGVVTMMILLSPMLTLAALASISAALLATRILARYSQPRFRAQWRWTGTLNGMVEETYSGHTLVKVFGHRDASRKTFEESNTALRDNTLYAQFISGLIQPVIMFIGNLGFIAVVIFGALRVLSGGLTIGTLQAFIQYVRQLNQPVSQVSSMVSILQSAAASAERVFELLDAPEQSPEPAEPATAPEGAGLVIFDHVRFRYDPDIPLFENVSLVVDPGQTVAIVGPTGAGKTTLVNLLLRFYDIDQGAIRLDGVDTRTMSREGLRRHFGMVLQDTWLFSGTIHDNIAYGRDDATENDVLEAARACHVDDFVRTLPEGYATLIDDNGSGLSTGQRQLLAIARAFLAQPDILILDEATSSVDTRTEVLVQQAMARLQQGRTSFVIAHRLSTIRDADQIVYMEKGNVLEHGSHNELMARKGKYWQLQMSQLTQAE